MSTTVTSCPRETNFVVNEENQVGMYYTDKPWMNPNMCTLQTRVTSCPTKIYQLVDPMTLIELDFSDLISKAYMI